MEPKQFELDLQSPKPEPKAAERTGVDNYENLNDSELSEKLKDHIGISGFGMERRRMIELLRLTREKALESERAKSREEDKEDAERDCRRW